MQTLTITEHLTKQLKSLLTTYETNNIYIPSDITQTYVNELITCNLFLFDIASIVAKYIDVICITMNYNPKLLKSCSYITAVSDYYDLKIDIIGLGGKHVKRVILNSSKMILCWDIFCPNNVESTSILTTVDCNDLIDEYISREYVYDGKQHGDIKYINGYYYNVKGHKFKSMMYEGFFICKIINKIKFEEMISLIELVKTFWNPFKK